MLKSFRISTYLLLDSGVWRYTKKVIRAFRNQRRAWLLDETRFLGVRPIFARAHVYFLRLLQGFAYQPGVCEMSALREEQKPESPASEIAILQGVYQLQSAYRLAHDLGVDVKVVTRVYQRMREALYHLAQLEGYTQREIELDEADFGGKRQAKRGPSRGWQKCRLWAPGEGTPCVYQ